jgi:hypothetical protein
MFSPSRLVRFAVWTVSALALTGCASTNVSSYLERENDFARYRTYNWAPAEALETGDPRLDNNPFFHERIQGDVEKQLATRGFEKTASGAPDVLVHYHASVGQRIDVNSIDRESGNCYDAHDCRPYVYEAGTLLIDFVDGRTNKLVWRGWAQDSVDGVIDNQDRLAKQINQAVTRMMERLPRHL